MTLRLEYRQVIALMRDHGYRDAAISQYLDDAMYRHGANPVGPVGHVGFQSDTATFTVTLRPDRCDSQCRHPQVTQ